MKEKTSLRFSIMPTVIVAIVTLLVSSAFVSSSSIPVNHQGLSTKFESVLQNASAGSNSRAASLIRIAFARGTTSGSAAGSLAAGTAQSYVLWAGWSQTMVASVESPDGKTFLDIYTRWSGISLCRLSNALTSWQGVLPRSEDYVVKVTNSGGSAQNYSLTVTIPARIRFARGAYSGSVWGRGSAAKVISYVLWARANQTMTATLSSSTGSVYLSIRGFSGGQSLVSSSDSKTTWTGTLPQSQDYIVEAVQGGALVDFTLTVTIV
jgi:hypothetical protein